MLINVRFRCVDIPIGVGNGSIRMEEGSTVLDVVRLCKEEYDIELSISELHKSLFLVNSKPANLDTILEDNDSVSVVRLLAGG